jgi:hypothetical protein
MTGSSVVGQAYVAAGGANAKLIGEISPRGNKFVKTVPDNTPTDNLLKLPECDDSAFTLSGSPRRLFYSLNQLSSVPQSFANISHVIAR